MLPPASGQGGAEVVGVFEATDEGETGGLYAALRGVSEWRRGEDMRGRYEGKMSGR